MPYTSEYENFAKPRDTFVANAIYNINTTRSYETLILISYASDYAKQYPNASSKDIQLHINELRKKYDAVKVDAAGGYDLSKRTPALVAFSMIKILRETGDSRVAGAVVEEFSNWWYRYGSSVIAPDMQISAQKHLLFNFNFATVFQNKVLGEAHDIARNNDVFEFAFDTLFSRQLGAKIGDSSQEIFQRNPNFALAIEHNKIFQLIEGGLAASSEAQKKISEQVLQTINDRIDEVQKDLTKLGLAVGDLKTLIVEYEEKRKAREENAAAAKRKHDNFSTNVEGLRSAIYILQKIMGLGNPEYAQRFSVVMNSAIDFAISLSNYRTNSENEATAEAAGVIFTANIIAIGMTIVSAFANSGPSADKIMLSAMRQISAQIEDVRKEMHERFSRVDTRLENLLDITIEGFQAISRDISNLGEVAQDTARQVKELADRMQFSTRQQAELFRQGVYIDHIAIVAKCFRFASDTPTLEIKKGEYAGCLRHFKSMALTLPQLTGFELSADVPFDLSSSDWAFSPLVSSRSRILAELDHIFELGVGIPTYRPFNEAVFLNSLSAYIETVRTWPSHRGLLAPSALTDFKKGIEKVEHNVQRLKNGGDEWDIIKLVDTYYKAVQAVDRELYVISDQVTRTGLGGFGGHIYQLFLSAEDDRQRNDSRIEDAFTVIGVCGSKLIQHYPVFPAFSFMKEADGVWRLKNGAKSIDSWKVQLGAQRLPVEFMNLLKELDRSTSKLVTMQEDTNGVCYTLEMNLEYRTRGSGVPTVEWAPKVYVHARVDDEELLRASWRIFSEWPRLHDDGRPIGSSSFDYGHILRLPSHGRNTVNATKTDFAVKGTKIIAEMIKRAGKDPVIAGTIKELRKRGGLRARIQATRELYVDEVKAAIFDDGVVRKNAILATYLKSVLSRILREEWAEPLLVDHPAIGALAYGGGMPDIASLEANFAKIAHEVDLGNDEITPVIMGDWVAPKRTKIVINKKIGSDVGEIVKVIKEEIRRSAIDDILATSLAIESAKMEIGMVEGMTAVVEG